MRKMHSLPRHKKFQIVVTIGIVGSFIVVTVDPAYALHSAAINAFAGLVWLWE